MTGVGNSNNKNTINSSSVGGLGKRFSTQMPSRPRREGGPQQPAGGAQGPLLGPRECLGQEDQAQDHCRQSGYRLTNSLAKSFFINKQAMEFILTKTRRTTQ